MSTISATGGSTNVWVDRAGTRASTMAAMKEKLFAKVDSDGNGTVDKTELQSMVEHVAKATGTTAADADTMLAKMDTDGNGSLSADELDAGMQSLLPPPSSTVDFAQRRAGSGDAADADDAAFKALDTDGDGSISKAEFSAGTAGTAGVAGQGHQHGGPHGPEGAGGPPPGAGMPPPPQQAAAGGASASASSSSSTSSTSATDPLDTNGDGVVSAQERAAGELADMVKALSASLSSSGGIDKADADAFTSRFDAALKSALAPSGSTKAGGSDDADARGTKLNDPVQRDFDLSALRKLVEDEYSRTAANHEAPISTVSETV